jgi:hypothetical protein
VPADTGAVSAPAASDTGLRSRPMKPYNKTALHQLSGLALKPPSLAVQAAGDSDVVESAPRWYQRDEPEQQQHPIIPEYSFKRTATVQSHIIIQNYCQILRIQFLFNR